MEEEFLIEDHDIAPSGSGAPDDFEVWSAPASPFQGAKGGATTPLALSPPLPHNGDRQMPLAARRSRGGGTSGIDRGKALESPRKPGGRRRSKQPVQSGGLSQRTLSIVTNLEGHKPVSMSKKEFEEQEEEKRLALEERQQREAQRTKEEGEAYTIRILMLGDSGVGKTSLMHRYSEDAFAPNILSTAGVDFKVQHLDIDGRRVRCQIWDTAGQEKFHIITRAYYRGAHGIALVYDVTDADSYKNVNYWMANLATHAERDREKAGSGGAAAAAGGAAGGSSSSGGAGGSSHGQAGQTRLRKMVLGNKVDLGEQRREISTQEGRDVATEYGALFYEVSAKDGTGVRDAFYALACDIVRKLDEGKGAPTPTGNRKSDLRSLKPVQTIFLTKRPAPSFRNRMNGAGSDAEDATKAAAAAAAEGGEAGGRAGTGASAAGAGSAGGGLTPTSTRSGSGRGSSLFKSGSKLGGAAAKTVHRGSGGATSEKCMVS